ncbi:hypothetical protein [Desulfitobacterium metallireducens]|uniref:Uncharacterized protein n=1 Tax=Desulfitobacterium metallireducens DSM 15288 TaxID=871968 RepID=W0EH49_9FIRM|nr:hypothetical protein [Desulfitobacterium metallireducens]AHF08391.1 hypothetical protein DESME_01710 [Desulfitobacterium metallireducens DSM 15288]
MSFLPVVLFVLGIIVLIMAWRLGNPPNTSPELLAALKGIAGVKRDIGYIRSELQETGARLEEHERRIQEQPIVNRQDQREKQSGQADQEVQLEFLKALQQHTAQEPISNSIEDVAFTQDLAPRVISDKYRGVIELHEQGWSTLEIAGHLALSQDAVNMVLKTYPRGGQR